MLVNERTLGSRIRRGYRGFGAAGQYPLWSDAQVMNSYPVGFANGDAYDDAMNAPNSKSGSAGQNGGTALVAISQKNLTVLQQWMMQAVNTVNTTGALASAALACQENLAADCAAMDAAQHSDQNIIGIDNGRSSKQNAAYKAAFTALDTDIKTWINNLSHAAAADTAAGTSATVSSSSPMASTTASAPAYVAYSPGVQAAMFQTPPMMASQAATIAPTTDYTPYIIGGIALLVVGGGFMFMKNKKRSVAT